MSCDSSSSSVNSCLFYSIEAPLVFSFPKSSKSSCSSILDSSPPSSSSSSSNIKITLNKEETEIFEMFLKCVDFHKTNSTLRAAGGWVRDKVMGNESSDIDIAIDNLSGIKFTELFNVWSKKQGMSTFSVGVINKNADKSKHLETATIKIQNKKVDFVNLRGENYTEDSRVPNVTIGTPLEDAHRRDLTINSLFYNINEGIIEDFTGKGIEDIKKGVIRTPLNPNQTFLDDPLRILRAIRFACRFNFSISEELKNSTKNSEIILALGKKVSRERVCNELSEMLNSKNAIKAINLIRHFGIFDVIFPTQEFMNVDSKSDWSDKGVRSLELYKNFIEKNFLQDEKDNNECFDIISNFSVFLLHFYERKQINEKKNEEYDTWKFVINVLKFPRKVADRVLDMQTSADQFLLFLSTYFIFVDTPNRQNKCRKVDNRERRRRLGLIVRKAGERWMCCIAIAYALYCVKMEESQKDELKLKVENFLKLKFEIERLNLCMVYKLTHLLNGNIIKSILPNVPKGPAFKLIMDEQINWQLENENGTAQECEYYLKEKYKDYL